MKNDEIAYANEEEGTLNAYICVQGGERPKNWSQDVYVQNGWILTVPLKDISGSLILKIFNIVLAFMLVSFFSNKYRTLFTNYNVHER